MQIVPSNKYLTQEERSQLLQKSDWKAFVSILFEYTWLFAALALVYFFPIPITVIIALFVVGGKQLACAILMHDASHNAMFKTQWLNDFFGSWFGAYPIFLDLQQYRPYHYNHHINNGLEDDPDLLLTRGYPTSRKSLIRKFARDLFGITGVKAFIGAMLMHAGIIEFNLGNKVVWTDRTNKGWTFFFKNWISYMWKPILFYTILTGIFIVLNAWWLILVWFAAYLTTFQFSLRVRSIAEHSVSEERENPYKNTRTTYANFFEQLLFAPFNVNYHTEHHLLMGVPSYNLPKLHTIIYKNGYFKNGVLAKNYLEVLRLASAS